MTLRFDGPDPSADWKPADRVVVGDEVRVYSEGGITGNMCYCGTVRSIALVAEPRGPMVWATVSVSESQLPHVMLWAPHQRIELWSW